MTAITHDLPNAHIRFEPEVLERLKREARENERSLPAQIRWIVNQHLQQQEAPK